MILFVLETLEGFAKGEVPDEVEGREVVPSVDVDYPRGWGSDLLVEFLDEKIGVRVEEGFLFAEGFAGEGVC